jgi:hypothetical protein
MLVRVAGEVFVRARPFLKLMARAIQKQPSGTLEAFFLCSVPLRPMEFHPFEPHSLHLFLSVIDGRHS